MAIGLTPATFESKYNNTSTGLYKTGQVDGIGSDDHRELVTDIKDNFVNKSEGIKYSVVTGVNAKSGTTSPATSSYVDGQIFLIYNSTSNLSTAVTLNLGGGAKTVWKMGNNTLSASADMLVGAFYFVTYRSSIDKFVIIGDILIAGDGLARAGATISVSRDEIFTNTENPLVDGATIDINGKKNTLATSEAAITFTISYPGDECTLEVILAATSSTFTFPANTLCVSDGTASGDNTCSLSGTSGDRYILIIRRFNSNYSVDCKNYGQ